MSRLSTISPEPDPHETFSVPKAAKLYGYSVVTLKLHIKNGLCNADPVKPGSKHLRVSRADMLELRRKLASKSETLSADDGTVSTNRSRRSPTPSSRRTAGASNTGTRRRFSGRILSDEEADRRVASINRL